MRMNVVLPADKLFVHKPATQTPTTALRGHVVSKRGGCGTGGKGRERNSLSCPQPVSQSMAPTRAVLPQHDDDLGVTEATRFHREGERGTSSVVQGLLHARVVVPAHTMVHRPECRHKTSVPATCPDSRPTHRVDRFSDAFSSSTTSTTLKDNASSRKRMFSVGTNPAKKMLMPDGGGAGACVRGGGGGGRSASTQPRHHVADHTHILTHMHSLGRQAGRRTGGHRAKQQGSGPHPGSLSPQTLLTHLPSRTLKGIVTTP
jgi:hypothetical protein